MNIYLHVEISVRELDSKLLLATLAAARGHQVIVSDMESILKGIDKKVLTPGIFHTKSITPSGKKIARHESLIEKGFKITSIDEEAGLDIDGYEEFSESRYSDQTVQQASAVFGWGEEDVESLKKNYKKYESKFHKTGSPRVDLWKPFFSDYWGIPKQIPKKPFLLIPSNTGLANYTEPFHKFIKMKSELGYYKRVPKLLEKDFGMVSEEFTKMHSFIEAIKFLAKNNNSYDIVLRPHPAENIDAWKFYLKDISNVHVIHKDSISAWVNNAFAIMHNGCTTALEATISMKPVVTYIPFKQIYGNDIPNRLGHIVNSLEDLSKKVNSIFQATQSESQKKNVSKNEIHEDLVKKIYFDDKELAAEKIVKIWEKLANDNLSHSVNWSKYYWFLKIINLRKLGGRIKRKLLPSLFGVYVDNHKIPQFNEHDINDRVQKLKHLLRLNKKIECKVLSKRTILIKQF